MKKLLLLMCLALTSSGLCAQYTAYTNDEAFSAITIGVLNGGGGLLGADLEIMMNDRVGIQLGAGLVSFGAALNFHLKPGIRSSFVSIQYFNQGTGESFVQNAIGPSFNYRGKKWLYYQIGLAKTLSKGPAWPVEKEHPSVMLTYAIGTYFPL